LNLKRKKVFAMSFLLIVFCSILCLAGCEKKNTEKDDGKLKVIATIFSYYDFVREVGGEHVNVSMLVPAGKEAHSFEPTAADLIKIEEADVFLYNGGALESWVPQMLKSLDDVNAVSMMDTVDMELLIAGHSHEEHDHEHEHDASEYDEHIWTSPANAKKIVTHIVTVLSETDPDHKDAYEANGAAYIEKLTALQNEIKEVVNNAKRKTLIFGDQYPLLYFSEEFGLNYQAAFSGCSADSEPSAATLASLIDYVAENDVPAVYHIELSQQKIADTICEATGAKKLLFHTCHNVTKEDLANGVTYLSLMQQNIANLKEGLN